jgi:hypothetical protein
MSKAAKKRDCGGIFGCVFSLNITWQIFHSARTWQYYFI